MRRLFVALSLPETVREQISDLQSGLDGARWIDFDNLHLTLRFVGEVEGGVAEDLLSALSTIRAPSFDLRFSGFGHFETKGRPHALWVGIEPEPALFHLRDKVEAAAKRAGLKPEGRKFKPHVTIARFYGVGPAAVSKWIGQNSPFTIDRVPVRDFTLFRSRLGREGARYQEEAAFPLAFVPGMPLTSDAARDSMAGAAVDPAEWDIEPDWASPDFDMADWIGAGSGTLLSAP